MEIKELPMTVEIEGYKVSLRLHPVKNLVEARLTYNKKRKSYYGKTVAEAHDKAKAFIETITKTTTVQIDADLRSFFAIWIASTVGADYSNSPVKNTRVTAEWGIGEIIDAAGNIRIEGIQLSDAKAMWGRITNKFPNTNTQRTIYRYFYKAFRILHREGHTRFNFAEEIDRPKSKKREYVPTIEQSMKLWLINRDDRLGVKIFLQFVLGVCDEEACTMTIEQLGGGELLVHGTKNDYRDRTIYIPERIEEILSAYADGKKRFMIENTRGNPVCAGSTRDIKVRYQWADVPYAANHGLRHAFGAIETEVGCPPSIRMAILGQSLEGLVQGIYVHPTPANMRDWLQKWSDYLGLDRPECLPQSGVQLGVRDSRELRVESENRFKFWSEQRDSNSRPLPPQRSALPS